MTIINNYNLVLEVEKQLFVCYVEELKTSYRISVRRSGYKLCAKQNVPVKKYKGMTKEKASLQVVESIIKADKDIYETIKHYANENYKKGQQKQVKKLNYSQFMEVMENTEKEIFGVIVYKESNWKTKYSLESRSYKVSNKNKYFLPNMCGSSLFGSNLDGTDVCVRLDYYNFKVDYFYILEDK